MAAEINILEPARQRLEELLKRPVRARRPRRRGEGPDILFHAGKYIFVVEAKASNRLASIHRACDQARVFAKREGSKAVPLVAVPFMGPSGRRVCQDAGVGFVDVAGNAHLEAPGLLVHVEGKPDLWSVPGRPSSVFAPRSSRVARLLLLDPRRWWQQKELADRSTLGRGYISRIASRLAEDGLLEQNGEGRIRPSDPDLMLNAWRDVYDIRRHRIIAGHIAARSGEELVGKLADAAREHGVEYALTGLPAAAMLAPFANFRLAAAYLRQSPKDDLLERLAFHKAEQGANSWLIVPNDGGVFDGSKEVRGLACVSAVQAYLDLLGMPERASEAAEHLREVCLRWR